MKKYVFVILHYYTIEDTEKCIESIFEIGKEYNVDVVIVDNASPNKTGAILKEKYQKNNNVHVLINESNFGFARGNNVGFKYAKDNLNPDFIIMCNNDTYLLQSNFFELIEEEYNYSHFSVLGPKILLRNNKINPVITELPTLKIAKKQLTELRLDYITNLFFINKLYKITRRIIKNIFIKLKLKKINIKKNDENKRYENIVLHGCFYVFSKDYIEKFDGIDDRTFLYREEELLALRLKNNNLTSVYNPNIQIFHNEDGATNAITKSNRKKQLFVCKNLIISTKILLKELKGSL